MNAPGKPFRVQGWTCFLECLSLHLEKLGSGRGENGKCGKAWARRTVHDRNMRENTSLRGELWGRRPRRDGEMAALVSEGPVSRPWKHSQAIPTDLWAPSLVESDMRDSKVRCWNDSEDIWGCSQDQKITKMSTPFSCAFGLLHYLLFSIRNNNSALGFKWIRAVIMATPQLLKSVLHMVCIDSVLVASVFLSIANVNISVTCKDVLINSALLIFLMLQTHLSLC